MKIALFELEKWEEEYFRKRLKGHKLYFFSKPLTAKTANKIKDADIVAAFIYSELKSNTLSQLRNLKLVTTMSTGAEHIDLEYCKKNNIKACNVPYYGENTVAEHAFALMLALSRKIYDSVEKTRHDNFSISGLKGFDLKGKTLGVIGAGHIGQHVIKIAKGFDMNVIAYGTHQDKSLSRKFGFKWASFDSLLKNSDIITIHVPLNDSTRHMISIEAVKKMKNGVFLINTARGEIVDTTALLYGLNKKIIAGAGLDVLEGECEIKEERELLKSYGKECDLKILFQNHLLLKDKNVIITPHSAFYTQEALERILDTTVSNINNFVKGKTINQA